MRKHVKKIKTCVNCRHLEILEEGQEVHGLKDTAYITFRCDVFNYAGKEVFRFPTGDKRVVIEKESEDDCPFWEDWNSGSEETRSLIGDDDGLDESLADDPDEY